MIANKKVTPKELVLLQQDIHDRIKDNYISNVIVDDTDHSSYDYKTKIIYIPSIVDLTTYLCALHEIAHYMLKHSPIDWDSEVRCEIEAWEWVYVNSVYKVPNAFKRNVEKERLKGSWE